MELASEKLADADSSIRKAVSCARLVSRNVYIGGRRTSIRLEADMWDALYDVAAREGKSIHDICTSAQKQVNASSATSAVRVFLVRYYRALAQNGRHEKAAAAVARMSLAS